MCSTRRSGPESFHFSVLCNYVFSLLQSGLRMYESKHDMDGMTRDAVASIEMAEFCEAPSDGVQIQGMPGNNLAQLASLAVIKQEPLSKLAKMCKQCLEGTCEVSAKTGEPCMPPEKG